MTTDFPAMSSDSGGYQATDHPTQEVQALTPHAVADIVAKRIGLALAACEGIDAAVLANLSARRDDGRTNLQAMVDHVAFRGTDQPGTTTRIQRRHEVVTGPVPPSNEMLR